MFLKPPHEVSIATSIPEQRYEPAVRFTPAPTSNTWMSPGSRAAQSTQPPCCGARNVVWKNDSPLRKLRLSDFMKPPSAFDSISTPPDIAIIAPDSARHSSPEPSWMRQTEKAGLCRTVISIESLQGLRRKEADPICGFGPRGRAVARQLDGRTFSWRLALAA